MKYKCSKCRMSFSLAQEGPIGCPSCGQVIAGRKEVPTKVPLPPKAEAALPEPSDWGCTDLLEPVPVAPKPTELPPDPLPEYITADQARKWGIKIRFFEGLKNESI